MTRPRPGRPTAIREACAQLDRGVLAWATLSTSTEPCAMCAGAIYWSGVTREVFGPVLGEEARRVHDGYWGVADGS